MLIVNILLDLIFFSNKRDKDKLLAVDLYGLYETPEIKKIRLRGELKRRERLRNRIKNSDVGTENKGFL